MWSRRINIYRPDQLIYIVRQINVCRPDELVYPQDELYRQDKYRPNVLLYRPNNMFSLYATFWLP